MCEESKAVDRRLFEEIEELEEALVEHYGLSGLLMRGSSSARRKEESAMGDEGKGYLLAGQLSELERLQLQSRVWESTGRQLLSQLDGGTGGRVLDVGCGVMSWLRILSE